MKIIWAPFHYSGVMFMVGVQPIARPPGPSPITLFVGVSPMAALAYTQATSKRKITCRAWDEVDKILEKKLLVYRSRAEFVAEVVRDKLTN